MLKKTRLWACGFILVAAAILLMLWRKEQLVLALGLAILGVLALSFVLFEAKAATAEKLVLLAVLCALSSAGRVLFTPIPSVQPSSFIIIVTGMVFGPEMGFMCGSLTAFASNLLLGQGPWTPFQMFAWGAMGFLSALLSGALEQSRLARAAYGVLWGFVFGWFMNLWFMHSVGGGGPFLPGYIAACVASLPFDLAHALSNAFFLLLISDSFLAMLRRVSIKYGLVTQRPLPLEEIT